MRKKIGMLLLIMLCSFSLVGCGTQNEIVDTTSTLEEILEENNYTIVDVRTSEEYKEGHVKKAINIPYDEIDENVELDKEKTILVYCRSGRRSKVAYDQLTSLSYEVYDLGAYDSLPLEKE